MMPRQRKSTDIRQLQIIEAAQALIRTHGSEHLTVRRIAKKVGISEGAIYRHFSSKAKILSFLLQHIETVLITEVSPDRLGADRATLGAIERVLANHFEGIEKRNGISFQVVAEIISLGDKKLNRQALRTTQKYIACLKELLDRGMRDGSLREDLDTEAAAALLFGLIQSLANNWALSNCSFDLGKSFTAQWRIYSAAIQRR
jgi:TetR/AcrR family transcriptional regulator